MESGPFSEEKSKAISDNRIVEERLLVKVYVAKKCVTVCGVNSSSQLSYEITDRMRTKAIRPGYLHARPNLIKSRH
jgi:hypothetical protein